MSIVMEILEGLWDIKLRYKGVPVNFFGVPLLWDDKKDFSKNSFRKTLSKLKEKGFIEINQDKWTLTEAGKKFFESKNKLYKKFYSPFALNSPKKLLLIFDIPETKRAERNWLRRHLKEFQYFMIQQSVWVGPSPLPKKFCEHLKEISLNKYIKTFKLARPYNIK